MNRLEELVSTMKNTIDSGYYSEGSHDFPLQSFTRSLRRKSGNPVIAELKLTSYDDHDMVGEEQVEGVLRKFASNGASAISILPEPTIYRGKLEHISIAKRQGLPVLVSDFIIDKSQLACARSWGGDAVFLLYSFFRSRWANLSLEDMMAEARVFGLEVVLEVGNVSDFLAAVRTDADAIGINNLDFVSGEVDIKRTLNILTEAEAVLSEGIRNKPIISMEGINSREDIETLRRAGVSAFLVGNALFEGGDPGERLSRMV